MYCLALFTSIVALLNRAYAANLKFRCRTGSPIFSSIKHSYRLRPKGFVRTADRRCKVFDTSGIISPYEDVWKLQHKLVANQVEALHSKNRTDFDYILCVQHEHVYTLGQSGNKSNIYFDVREVTSFPDLPGGIRESNSEDPVYRVERGGDVTYHGPGQLVVYPIIDLREAPCGKDLHKYLRSLEEAGIRTLRSVGIDGHRSDGGTGVWVTGKRGEDLGKIQAIGVKVKTWVTMHGIALNIHPDLNKFKRIVPCGLQRPVCSLRSLEVYASMEEIKSHMLAHLSEIFALSIELQHNA